MVEKKKIGKKAGTIIIALILILFLFSCDVISVYPITSVRKAYFSKKIIGIWVNENSKNDKIAISIKEKPIYFFDDGDTDLLPFYISKVKGNYYMNIIINDDLKLKGKGKIPIDINFVFFSQFQ